MSIPSRNELIPPGSWLGMLGGGQLGRMFCHAAQQLGYKVAVLDPASSSPAGAVADLHIRGAYDDRDALDRLASLCRSITTEFENVPAASLAHLASRCRVSPASEAVDTAQDRIKEKAFLASTGVAVAPHAVIRSAGDIPLASDGLFPGILKAARLGYDGKGQVRVATREEALAGFKSLGEVDCVLEAMLPLDHEISVVVARGFDGESVVYPPAVNEHRNGILAVSTVARETISGSGHAVEALEAARSIAHALDYCGVLCVEFFVLTDGSLVANEMAPRPHNSGHYTQNASVTSQFEQQARVMAGLPLGDTSSLCAVVMLNLLGDVWFDPDGGAREPDWTTVLQVPGAKLHLYGKEEARPGRKMGHVNCLGDDLNQARQNAARVAQAVGIAFEAS